MRDNNIEVSVIGIVYNQQNYLKKMIDSLIAQKTDFNYEIILHDDCSTDNSLNILKYYKDKYPNKIKLITEEINQYSQGIDSFRVNMVKKASGKYIAMCEGDDFWLDDEKLSYQYNILENNPECDMCACMGCTVSEDGEKEISVIRPREKDSILTTEDVIMGGGQYLVTAGLFFRKSLYDLEMPFERIIPLDYVLQIRGSLRGGIAYIDRKMAAYRRNTTDSWSERVLKNRANLREQWDKEKSMLKLLDYDTGRRYHDIIMKRLNAYTFFVDQLEERKKDVQNIFYGLSGSKYLWGMGRRGVEFEEFCVNMGFDFDGICDLTDEHIGEHTAFGTRIFSTRDVLACADNILATNQFAYDYLIKSNFKGNIVNLQTYMPYG